ncbi:hypothetical protein B5M42_001220 [Paenibacillus athensensis]|uniref:Uncharacterized protein n=1 Tax=Paenibacillus athensensis TaxID=1967502 RepID=A0A4Y8Q916_9BACL|nr:hypothetical protein [Paenibacillus athensensis]MCD1257457.1 hypothetical protein [Paenibacillus athensensis]
MNKESWKRFVDRLKSRYAILIAAMAVGLLVNTLVLVWLVVPAWTKERSLNHDLANLQQQKISIQSRPNPLKVTDEQILDLVKQVPTKPEVARLLLSLKSMEKDAKVTLNSVKFGDNKTSNDSLSGLLSGGALPSDSSSVSTDVPAASAAPNPSGQANPIVEDKLTVVFTGEYHGMIHFLEKLNQSERYIRLTSWQLDTNVKSTAADSNNGGANLAEKLNNSFNDISYIQATLNLSVYSVPSYDGKLQELPPVELGPTGKRTDPTSVENTFNKLLKEMGKAGQGDKP